jgi:hypothetical protein
MLEVMGHWRTRDGTKNPLVGLVYRKGLEPDIFRCSTFDPKQVNTRVFVVLDPLTLS